MDEDVRESLFKKALLGDREALGQLLHLYGDSFRAIARQQIPADRNGANSASDEVQEAFVNALKRFDTFRGTSLAEFEAWLKSILQNSLANSRRKNLTAKRNIRRTVCFGDNLDPPAPVRTPVDALMGQEAIALIARLPERSAEVLVRFLEGAKRQDIAEEFMTTERAVSSVIYRAILQIRDMYLSNDHTHTE